MNALKTAVLSAALVLNPALGHAKDRPVNCSKPISASDRAYCTKIGMQVYTEMFENAYQAMLKRDPKNRDRLINAHSWVVGRWTEDCKGDVLCITRAQLSFFTNFETDPEGKAVVGE